MFFHNSRVMPMWPPESMLLGPPNQEPKLERGDCSPAHLQPLPQPTTLQRHNYDMSGAHLRPSPLTLLNVTPPARMSHKNASYESVLKEKELSTRCPARVSHKSVRQESSARVSHKSERHTRCPTRERKSVPQGFWTRVSCKSALQECLARVWYNSVPQECRT